MPTPVRAVNATFDPATGYYGFTTSEAAGVPSRTILTSPADAPGDEGPTILTGPVQMPDRPMVTTYLKPGGLSGTPSLCSRWCPG